MELLIAHPVEMKGSPMQPVEDTSVNGASRMISELTAQMAAMKRELESVKREVQELRTKCSDINKTLISLCCPKEWYTEEIDEKELAQAMARADEQPTIAELIESLAKSDTLSDVKPL
jgi:hypothetical protein